MRVALADIRFISDLFPHMKAAQDRKFKYLIPCAFVLLHVRNTYPICATCEEKVGKINQKVIYKGVYRRCWTWLLISSRCIHESPKTSNVKPQLFGPGWWRGSFCLFILCRWDRSNTVIKSFVPSRANSTSSAKSLFRGLCVQLWHFCTSHTQTLISPCETFLSGNCFGPFSFIRKLPESSGTQWTCFLQWVHCYIEYPQHSVRRWGGTTLPPWTSWWKLAFFSLWTWFESVFTGCGWGGCV